MLQIQLLLFKTLGSTGREMHLVAGRCILGQDRSNMFFFGFLFFCGEESCFIFQVIYYWLGPGHASFFMQIKLLENASCSNRGNLQSSGKVYDNYLA